MATKTKSASYAIIAVGGKQYVVHEGERLLVDRLGTDEGKTFHPDILFVGGDGKADLRPSATVTARVVGHVLGDKVRIGKYRPKTGYKRHTGFRAKLSQIEIESIGAKRATAAAPKQETPAAPKQEAPAAPKQETPAPKPKEPAAVPAQPPRGYADLTVAEIAEKSKRWKLESAEAALAYEREHAKRKGAIAALESVIETKKGK
jgi:large subunit ribosomal protein L21